jgi:hypothetical protein
MGTRGLARLVFGRFGSLSGNGRLLKTFGQAPQFGCDKGIRAVCRTLAAVGAFAQEKLSGRHCVCFIPCDAAYNAILRAWFLPQSSRGNVGLPPTGVDGLPHNLLQ